MATGVAMPEVVDLLKVDRLETDRRFKQPPSALRAYLDLDRAEGKRRAAIRARRSILRRTLAGADAVSILIALVAGATGFGPGHVSTGFYGALLILGAVVLLVLLMKSAGLYDRDEHLIRRATLDEVPGLFQVATLGILLIWLLGGWALVGDISRDQLLVMWMLLFVTLVVGRSLARSLATKLAQPERCLVIGDLDAAEALRRKLRLDGSTAAEIVGRIPTEQAQDTPSGGTIPMLPPGLYRMLAEKQVHRVILAPGKVDGNALLHLVRELSAMVVSVSVLPATPPVAGSSVELDHLHGLTLLGARGFEMGRSSRLLKRSFDVVASSTMLALLSPLLLAIAVAVKLDSRGPVLFRQRRVGRDGGQFEMLKFRSMHDGSEALRDELAELNEVEGLFKIERDPRVTRVGDVIRRLSLDELPQLVNVLRGEMSLVGPRPLVPDEDSQIEGFYRRRLDLAPGITGYWQSLGASRIPMFEMVRLDYLYVATWSVWNDVMILLRTVPYVVRRRGR
jgi:exopolysaccharide biosynthesis polyprenyl glycosylphosphotransferase